MNGTDPLLGRVVGALAGLWQSATLYPAGHPARVNAADRLSLALRGVLDVHGGLVVDLARGRIRVDGGGWASLGEGHLGGLASAARERGVGRLRVSGPRERDLLVELVGALAGGQPLPALPAMPGNELGTGGTGKGPAPEDPWQGMVERLAALWGEIASARRFPDEEADRLVRGIAGLPGDGVVEPVRLAGGRAAVSGVPSPVAHSLDVARLSYLAGRVLGLDPEPLRELTLSGALADIGMVDVPRDLLTKQGTLTPVEFAIVRRHPVAGAEMLLATPGVPDLAGVVAWEHHRRRGGGGYPAVGGRERLHPATRVIQVADVYTALRSPRAFRPEIPETRARAILARMARSWLDEETVGLVLERVAPLGLAPVEAPVPA